MHNQLGEHGIVKGRNRHARLDPAFHPGLRRKCQAGDEAGAGAKTQRRIFGIDARLNGVATLFQRLRQDKIACRLADHPFHQIDAEHFFGDGMFDLKARIDFEEISFVTRHIVDEFHRAGGFIVHRPSQRERGIAQLRPQLGAQIRGRRFLDDFLVAALGRAIAFPQGDDAALAITENLHLDMARRRHKALQIKPRVTEISRRQLRHPGEIARQFRRVVAEQDADTAAAGRAFQHHGIGDFFCFGLRLFQAFKQSAARQQRHAMLGGQGARCVLEAKSLNMLGAGTDKGDAGLRQPFGKAGIFRQKAIAGMNRLGSAFAAGGDDGLDIQVGFGDRTRPQPHHPIRHQHRRRETVTVRCNADRFDPKPLQGTENSRGNLAAIGDQHRFEEALTHSRSGRGWVWDRSRCRDC